MQIHQFGNLILKNRNSKEFMVDLEEHYLRLDPGLGREIKTHCFINQTRRGNTNLSVEIEINMSEKPIRDRDICMEWKTHHWVWVFCWTILRPYNEYARVSQFGYFTRLALRTNSNYEENFGTCPPWLKSDLLNMKEFPGKVKVHVWEVAVGRIKL